ncbi:MAG TPA: DUF4388 domain-containing protein [Anaeromyxobacter sp.]|nr:DUF4388 domain-containing protein [Anaeromyxobacter sp.]
MPHGTSMKTGFQGTIGSLPLVDLLQVWSMNGFSGQVVVTAQGRTGHLYYVEGRVVHAECEELSGEDAVRRIVAWPNGAFELHPNVVTLHRTIQKSLSHLLLEAHQELDEQRRRAPAPAAPPASAAPAPGPPPPARAPPAPHAGRSPVLDQIQAIRGVTQVVRFGKDGRPAADSGPGGEALAAKGLYLFLTHAAAVGQAFGLHDLTFAAVHGAHESFVLAHSAGQFLCTAVTQDAAIDPVVAQLRALLTRPRAP